MDLSDYDSIEEAEEARWDAHIDEMLDELYGDPFDELYNLATHKTIDNSETEAHT